jgi:hypothetical protein
MFSPHFLFTSLSFWHTLGDVDLQITMICRAH